MRCGDRRIGERRIDPLLAPAAGLPLVERAGEVEAAVRNSWQSNYEPAAFRATQNWLLENNRPFMQQLTHFIVRLFFRGIYFKQTSRREWAGLLARNSPTMASLAKAGWRERSARRNGDIPKPYSFRHEGT